MLIVSSSAYFFGTPVGHLILNKNDVKSRLAGAGFPVINTGQAALRHTDSKLEPNPDFSRV